MKPGVFGGKLRLAALLALVFLGLGGVAYWDEWKTKQEKVEDQAKNKLVDFKPEDVQELDYYSKGSGDDTSDPAAKPEDAPKDNGVVQVTAVKKDGVWRLTKPVDSLADGPSIESLIKIITDYSYNKVITDKHDHWADFGLLEPQRHVTLRLGGDRAFTVYIGNRAPVGYSVYLRTSKDDNVLIGSQHLLVSSSKTLTDFRDKTLLKIDEAKLKNLTYERTGSPAIEITKADGKYGIVKPDVIQADGQAIKDFVDELNGIRVTSFIDAPDAATQALFAKPETTITWQGESGEKSTLKVVPGAGKGATEGKLLAAFDPAQRIFTLPDELKGKLKKDLTEFRNRRILDPDSLDAMSISVDGDEFKNIEGDWYTASEAAKFDATGKYTGPAKDKPHEQANIRAFMVDLEFAKTDRFLMPIDPQVIAISKDKSAPPEHRITLKYHDPAKKPVTIELFKSDDANKYLVRRSGSDYVFRVAKSAFNSMKPSAPGTDGDDKANGADLPTDEDGGGLSLGPDGKNSG